MVAANHNTIAGGNNPFAALRRFAPARTGEEQCEFCSAALAPVHRHLLEVASGKLICVCDPCALRFENVIGGRWKLVPRQTRALPEFRMTDAQWDSLALPIHLAFIFQSTPRGKIMAMYPSPAGATESLLPLSSWDALVTDNPALARMEPDVEALLVNRMRGARGYYLAPIDACYELTGLIRLHWRGLSGGEVVWREIGRFFDRLNAQIGPPVQAPWEVGCA